MHIYDNSRQVSDSGLREVSGPSVRNSADLPLEPGIYRRPYGLPSIGQIIIVSQMGRQAGERVRRPASTSWAAARLSLS